MSLSKTLYFMLMIGSTEKKLPNMKIVECDVTHVIKQDKIL